MTKADLIEEVSRVVEMTRKESEVIVEAIFDSIVRSLRGGDKIEIRGFGSFRTRQRQSRVGRNPKTGTRVEVPAKKIPYFKPSKELKDVVNVGGKTCRAQDRPFRSLRLLVRCLDAFGLHLEPLAVPVSDGAEQAGRLHILCDGRRRRGRGIPDCLPRRAQLHRAKPLSLHLGPPHGRALPSTSRISPASTSTGASELMALTRRAETHLRRIYRPDGLNLGMNIGESAGAGIAGHIHMHVLPRWTGDANFMSTVGETRVLPEELTVTWRRLKEAFAALIVAAGAPMRRKTQ